VPPWRGNLLHAYAAPFPGDNGLDSLILPEAKVVEPTLNAK
jgi:hypothetical protein